MHTNQDDLSHSKPKGLHVSQEDKKYTVWYLLLAFAFLMGFVTMALVTEDLIEQQKPKIEMYYSQYGVTCNVIGYDARDVYFAVEACDNNINKKVLD